MIRGILFTIVFIIVITGLAGCASNLTVSDSIVFADVTGYDLRGYHLIGGGTYSGIYTPGAKQYGLSLHARDSISGLTYLNFNPSLGYGMGIASKRFAVSVSAQLLMLGADVTVSPSDDLYLTGKATTAGSFGLTFLGRAHRSFAFGPFWRRDRFEGIVIGDQFSWKRDRRYFADSFGLKGSFVFAVSSESASLLTLGAGFSPKTESVFLSVGMNWFRIHW